MFELHNVYSLSEISKYKIEYVSLFAQFNEKWVICHLKDTNKWDCPGGKIEQNEKPLQAAMRELFEETGAVESNFYSYFYLLYKF
jgi:8-oxo-dGTP diphosphatase